MRKTTITFAALFSATLLLSGCGENQTVTTNTNDDRPRLSEQTKPVEEVYPVLKTKLAGQFSEFKLKSQTSKYLNDQKTAIELILSNTSSAFCEKQKPVLNEDEQQIKVIVKSKDQKAAIIKGEMVNNPAYEISLSKLTKNGETKLNVTNFASLNITDINNAILRGSLRTTPSTDGKIESYEGEFFTAICK